MKIVHLPTETARHRRVLHVDLRDRSGSSADSLRSDLEADLRRADSSMAALAEDLTEAALEGIRRYRAERAEAPRSARGLRKIPLHAARASVVAIETSEEAGEDLERAIDKSALRRRLRRALSR